MKFSSKLVVIGLALIFAATVILTLTSNTWFLEKPSEQRKQSTPNQWKTFQNDQFSFTFQYPPEAIVDISDPVTADVPKRVRVRLIGPESEPNTEITDGFTFYASAITKGGGQSLSDVAQRVSNSIPERRKVIEELQQGPNIGGRETFTFSVQSELGSEVVYSIIEGEGNMIFVSSSSVSIPNGVERNYSEMILKMHESLQTVQNNQ